MSLSNDFYDYAREGKIHRQRLGYKGVIVLSEQVGVIGDEDYQAADLTVGIIEPVVIYPDLGTGLDLPGKTGGPALDYDNSLTIGGSAYPGIAPAMSATVTAPDHTISSATVTTIDFTNLRNSDQGETGTVTVELVVPPSNVSLIENLANLTTIDCDFEYWNGTAYVAITATRRWDLANVFSYDVTLPSIPTGQFRIRSTFGADAVEGDYRFIVTLTVGDVKRFVAQDDFEVSA